MKEKRKQPEEEGEEHSLKEQGKNVEEETVETKLKEKKKKLVEEQRVVDEELLKIKMAQNAAIDKIDYKPLNVIKESLKKRQEKL